MFFCRGPYDATFSDFQGAIERTIRELPTKRKADLELLMTHNVQQLEDVSLPTA